MLSFGGRFAKSMDSKACETQKRISFAEDSKNLVEDQKSDRGL
jgi:hypothetical protein